MKKLNIELLVNIEAQQSTNTDALSEALIAGRKLTASAAAAVYSSDYDMRTALSTCNAAATDRLYASVIHAAWSDFFNHYDAHHLLLDSERRAQHEYLLADVTRRSYYNGVKTLTPFTAERGGKFYADYFALTPERKAKWLNDLLDRTGKDYKNHETAFKSRMTVRGLDSYGTVSDELARAMYVICDALGVDFTFGAFYTELRNNRVATGEAFTLVDGVDITVEVQKSGNATLRIDKALAAKLNTMLGA